VLYRLWKGRQFPAQLENAQFVLGDPALGKARHLTRNAVYVRSEAEAVDHINRGYYLRVEAEKGPRPTLVRLNLFQDGIRLT
jgi:hypothetical protein